jgi:putative hemolysin
MDYWSTIALVGVLVLVNAIFAGSEIALISMGEAQVRQAERDGGARGEALVRLARNPNRFLATIQIGITMAGFLASATAAVSLAEPLVPMLSFLGAAAGPAAIALVTLVLTFVTLVFGELAPKRLAMQYTRRWSLLVARPLDALAGVTRPVVWLLGRATDLTVRIFGGDPGAGREQLGPEELRELVAGHRGLNREQRTIITGALDIQERIVREVFVHRGGVVTLDADMPLTAARDALAASGKSRAPVVTSGSLDDVVGVVHLRDLLFDHGVVADVVRPPLLLPDTLRIADALRRFKAERQVFALVVGERGAVEGIVTLEDLLEELVGEIYDETDSEVPAVRPQADGSLRLPGRFPVHDLASVGVELSDPPRGDYATVAGLVLAVLGRIPERPGDRVRLADWTIEVVGVGRRAITAVRLTPHRRPRPARPNRRPSSVDHGPDVASGDPLTTSSP